MMSWVLDHDPAAAFYCPTCDTLLDVTEFDSADDPNSGMQGHDVHLECHACGWHASAIAQRSMCEAWEHVLGELKKATVLIMEPEVIK